MGGRHYDPRSSITMEERERQERQKAREKERQERLRQQQERERRAAMEARLVPLLAATERGSVQARREAAAIICERERVEVVERSVSELSALGVGAYAMCGSRRAIVVPPIVDAETFATRLHEVGHLLAGRCGGGDHQPDQKVTHWHHCLRCEVDAWQHAMWLAPFTRHMFQRLRRALKSYRAGTPGPVSARNAVDRLRGTVTFASEKIRRLKWDARIQRQARAMAEITRFDARMRERGMR